MTKSKKKESQEFTEAQDIAEIHDSSETISDVAYTEDVRVHIPVAEDIEKLAAEGKLYDFLLEQSVKFLNHAVDTCKAGKIPKEQRGAVINQLGRKYGLSFYGGMFVKHHLVEVIPKVFRDAIDSHNPKQTYDGEPNQNSKSA